MEGKSCVAEALCDVNAAHRQAGGDTRQLLRQQLLNRLNNSFRFGRFLQKIQTFPEDKTSSVQVQGIVTRFVFDDRGG